MFTFVLYHIKELSTGQLCPNSEEPYHKQYWRNAPTILVNLLFKKDKTYQNNYIM